MLLEDHIEDADNEKEAKTDSTTGESHHGTTTEESATSVDPLINPIRVNTIPVTLPTDHNEIKHLYRKEDDYNKAVNSIKVYFHTEVNDIKDEWESADPGVGLLAILQKKYALLCKYQVLEAFEKSLPVKVHSLVILVLNSVLCTAMGILLNVPTNGGLTGIIGVTLLLFYYADNLTSFVSHFISVFQTMGNDPIMRAYKRIQKDYSAGDDSLFQIVHSLRAAATTPLGDPTS